MTFILNLLYILYIILIISLVLYQMELKRRVLFSSLLALSVNTIPEEEIDHMFDSSSESNLEEDISELSSESNLNIVTSDYSSEIKIERCFISKNSELDLNLDLNSRNNATSSTSVQTTLNTTDIGVQTQSSDFEKVITSKLNEDFRSKADLLEFGSEFNIIPD